MLLGDAAAPSNGRVVDLARTPVEKAKPYPNGRHDVGCGDSELGRHGELKNRRVASGCRERSAVWTVSEVAHEPLVIQWEHAVPALQSESDSRHAATSLVPI